MENLTQLSDSQIISGVVNRTIRFSTMSKSEIDYVIDIEIKFTQTFARLAFEEWIMKDKCKTRLYLKFEQGGGIECLYVNQKFIFNKKSGLGTGKALQSFNNLPDAVLSCFGSGWGLLKDSKDFYRK